uniref:Uncharacterized protein n=1 Tax=Oryza brachyantha TaxID=4533 RepID=J3KU02_ORYBR
RFPSPHEFVRRLRRSPSRLQRCRRPAASSSGEHSCGCKSSFSLIPHVLPTPHFLFALTLSSLLDPDASLFVLTLKLRTAFSPKIIWGSTRRWPARVTPRRSTPPDALPGSPRWRSATLSTPSRSNCKLTTQLMGRYTGMLSIVLEGHWLKKALEDFIKVDHLHLLV